MQYGSGIKQCKEYVSNTFCSRLIEMGKSVKNCEKKAAKKQNKAKNMLFRETGIHCSNEPTEHIVVTNAGLVTGVQQEQLLQLCLPYGTVKTIIMVPGKSYCFIIFRAVSGASAAYTAIHGKIKLMPEDKGPLYLAYTETVPEVCNSWKLNEKPPGLIIYEDFVTPEEENRLLNCIKWNMDDLCKGQTLKHRKVKHFGYEFKYGTNNIDKNSPLTEGIPSDCELIFKRLNDLNESIMSSIPDQLTVNHYLPGQGIPPHVDTHSAFEDPILSLSLGSSVVMDFRNKDGQYIPVLLPQRSLLIMSQEARYAWSHGITPRKMDVVPASDGTLTVQHRSERTSFTFRKIRRRECDCDYHEHCDSFKRQKEKSDEVVVNDTVAEKLEALHVHKVYEEIVHHFSETRHKPWPNVVNFIESLPKGSLLVDVGCGNGKYFGLRKGIYEIGCDYSAGLLKLCQDQGFEVFNCSCLQLPIKSEVADACISIAVIHHLATRDRRKQAIEEIARILRPDGKALLYVWAKDQERENDKSSYLKQDRKNRKKGTATEESVCVQSESCQMINTVHSLPTLPIHTNRTQFQHKDLLVPWKLKSLRKQSPEIHPEKNIGATSVSTFYRYYHVFEEGELEQLCGELESIHVVHSYYDQGNWCVIFEKV